MLSSSWLQLFIDIDENTRKKRETIAKTEQLANGCIWLADREAMKVPSGKSLKQSLSSYAVVRGGTAASVLWYEDKDKKPKPDIRAYDPFGCQWEEGDGEIVWFCYRNYVSKSFIERKYKEKIKDGFNYGDVNSVNGKLLTYLVWDDEEWKLAINGEYIDWATHGLGYIPVHIRSCGAVPYLQSDKYSDSTMQYSFQSYAMNTRDIYDLESKLLSIQSSNAIESGRRTAIGEYDGTAGGKPNLEKVGYGEGGRNRFLYLNTAQGQKFVGFADPPDNRVTDMFYQRVHADLDVIGTIDPIAQGQMTRSGSGSLAQTLMEAALQFINPFRECVEDNFIWIAEECVRQFKNEKYDKVHVEGRDRLDNRYRIDISPEDVEETHFDCNLVPDRLRDKIQEAGLQMQLVASGLSSRRTAMLNGNLHKDPDREMDKMDEELAAQDPLFRYRRLAKYWKDQGTPEGDEAALLYMSLCKIAMESTVRRAMLSFAAPPEMTPVMNRPPTVSPQMETGAIAAQPENVVEVPQEATRQAQSEGGGI